MFPPAGWSAAPVLRVTRVSTASSALWDTAAPARSSAPSARASRVTVTDTARRATPGQVTPTSPSAECVTSRYLHR